MPPLADTQTAIREAIIDKRAAAILPRLVGGRDPTYRLSIHQRHYDASLVDVLHRRFPAIEWLVGSDFLVKAALDFVRRFPPIEPCLDEYGQDFPTFLAARRGTETTPWLAAVGALEWQLGEVAAAVDRPAVALDRLTAFEDIDLDRIVLVLQTGLAYVSAGWPVDELVKLHVGGNAPENLAFEPAAIWLEVGGSRGAFSIRRLDQPTYAFRRAIAAGQSIAAAIAAGNSADPVFDPGVALAGLFADGLVTSIAASTPGG